MILWYTVAMSNNCLDNSCSPKKAVEGSTGGCPDPFWELSGLSEFNHNVFDLIDVLAVLIDRDGIIRMFNRKAIETTGLSRAHALGKDACTTLFPEIVRRKAQECMDRHFSRNAANSNIQLPLVARDMIYPEVTWEISTVYDDSGAIYGIIGIGHVPPPAQCLLDDDLQPADKACVLAGALTHDMLNHNQVAMGYVELAMDRLKGGDEHCMLSRACKAIRRSSDIARNVHRLNRIGPRRCAFGARASGAGLHADKK